MRQMKRMLIIIPSRFGNDSINEMQLVTVDNRNCFIYDTFFGGFTVFTVFYKLARFVPV